MKGLNGRIFSFILLNSHVMKPHKTEPKRFLMFRCAYRISARNKKPRDLQLRLLCFFFASTKRGFVSFVYGYTFHVYGFSSISLGKRYMLLSLNSLRQVVALGSVILTRLAE